MKFSDIPQFIRDGGYEINVPLNQLVGVIERYESSYNLQMNPDFQRGHVWSEEQQIAYVEFFLRGGKTGCVVYLNCPNWQGSGEMGDMVCVDGLQRVTALTKFLNNKLPIFDGHKLSDFTEPLRMARAGHNLKFNINGLATKKEVLQWYVDLNSGGTVHTTEEIERVKEMIEKEG